ncbi:MAG: hypothetical protein R6X23_12085 [Acidimicrobiia bacterium]
MSGATLDRFRISRRDLVGAGLVVVVGAGVGGLVGGVAALAGLGLARWRGPRAPAAAAFAMLALAALLSVLEAPATGRAVDYLFDFALDRPVASDAGLAAGVLAFVSIVLLARAERARPPGPSGEPGPGDPPPPGGQGSAD